MGNDMYFENNDQVASKTVRRRKKQLYAAIRERMEFYFSDANLQKDRFLSRLISKNNEIELDVFLKFNKILQLTNNTHDLVKALKKSESLQLTEDNTKVSRVTPIREKINIDACTIYVEQLSCDADHDWLKDVFSKFGKVDYISIPKYKSSRKIKGFAFVEFDTPEAAKKAVEEFEKAGCCLTNQMNPEQLCSIATYEDDKFDGKNSGSQQVIEKNSKVQANSALDSNTEKKVSKKRKNSENDSETDNCVPKEKKLKKDEDNENLGKNKINERGEKSSCEEEQTEDEHKMEGDEKPGGKKKKNRKKKKSHKTKYVRDIQSYGLQILSKADWKRLRNKYLNIQKEKMKKLKQHLHRSQMNHSQRQQHMTHESQTKPRFEFKTGVVVKVTFDEPLEDANQVGQFKCHAKSFDNVEYVDVTQGSAECYIRFGNVNAVQQLMHSKPWENMAVLDGAEEEDYWEKMKRDRTEKFENKKRFNNKRGRNKLINKAEKLISKRIRLSVDE